MADATGIVETEAVPVSEERQRVSAWEYLESLLVTIILALFLTSFVVQSFKIPSQSMEPTLLVGDHLLVNKFIFGGTGAWYEKLLPYRRSPPRGHCCLQVSFRRPSILCEARDRNSRRPHPDCGSGALRQWRSAGRAVRGARPERQIRLV